MIGKLINRMRAPEETAPRLAPGWRHEYKYTISYKAMLESYLRLQGIMQPDSHAYPLSVLPTRPRLTLPGYTVATLYWDGIERKGVGGKMSGYDNRYRYRMRYYPDPDKPESLPQFFRLERKHRAAGASRKSSVRLSCEEAEALIDGTDFHRRAAVLSALRNERERGEFVSQFVAEQTIERLEPRLFVVYDRIPLIHPVGNVRLTFDLNLRVAPYSRSGSTAEDNSRNLLLPGLTRPIFEPNQLIMELKYDRVLPQMIALLLRREGMPLEAISKYIYCVEKTLY